LVTNAWIDWKRKAWKKTERSTMGGEKKDTLCYVKDPNYAWVPATLVKTEGDKAYVKIPQYKDEQSIMSNGGRGAKEFEERVVNLNDYSHKVLPLQNVDNNGNLSEYADMVQLPYLHEVSFSTFSTTVVIVRSPKVISYSQLCLSSSGRNPLQHEATSYRWKALHSYG
jgi:hypothetical protein